MGNRATQVKLRAARESVESNLAKAIEHPKFEAKFMAQALHAEQAVAVLEKRL